MVLGALLARTRERWGSFEILGHWQQGNFHHDVVLRVADGASGLPGSVLVVATYCNGGVKEVLCLPNRLFARAVVASGRNATPKAETS